MAMNPEVKAKWVAALRSGEYTQAQNALTDGDGFCCLGVLCDLHAEETGGGWDMHRGSFGIETRYLEEEAVLPRPVMAWSGLSQDCGSSVEIEGRTAALTDHNDKGCTFVEIADAIEKQL